MKGTQMVWSTFVRIFHWGLVSLFILAYYTSTSGDDDFHFIFGYLTTILLVLRVLYGFFSSGHANFSNFFYSPAQTWEHAKQIFKNRPDHHTGHSPMGAYMVFALLALSFTLVITGLISQGWTEYEGPLWAMNIMPGDALGRWSENVHEALPDILIVFIVLHLLGVLLASAQHQVNLIRAMITGKKHHK